MRLVILSIVTLVLTLAAGHAHADEKLPAPRDPIAKSHLEAGNKAYRLKDFEAAVHEYRAGVQAEPGPSYTFWYNLGQSYRQLGRYEDAIWFYTQFLAQAPSSLRLHRDAAVGFIDKMKAELDRAAAAAQPTDPAPTPMVEAGAGGQPAPEVPAPMAKAHEPWHGDRLGWAIVGVGAVGMGASIGLVVSGRSLDTQANTEDAQAERKELRDRASTRMMAGGIAGGVAVVALTVGVIRLARTPAGEDSDGVSLVPTGDGATLLVRGRF